MSLTRVETLSRERLSFSASLVNSSLAVSCSRQRAWNTREGEERSRGERERERERADNTYLTHTTLVVTFLLSKCGIEHPDCLSSEGIIQPNTVCCATQIHQVPPAQSKQI